MSFLLIRHGRTEGNTLKKYIGCRTDEPLCAAGEAELRARPKPEAARVFASPMRRCLQTAGILFPETKITVVPDFRECDFGAFEGLSHKELNGRPDYQKWIDSQGRLPFPGGESLETFSERCVNAFERLWREDFRGDTAIVAHGGTLMAIMAAYAVPARDYFEYSVGNGEGFILRTDGSWERLRTE